MVEIFQPTAMDEIDMTLEERVRAFERMELPGQSPAMHMGTSYLINDLWAEIQNQKQLIEVLTTTLRDRAEKADKLDRMMKALHVYLRSIVEETRDDPPSAL